MKSLSFLTAPFGIKAGFTLGLATVLLLAGCAAAPESPSGSADVRQKLNQAQSNPDIANNARTELRDAQEAVRIAEQPVRSDEEALGNYRVYMADNMIDIATAKATTRQAEAERSRMSEEREASRLAARTQEADRSRAAVAASERTAGDLQRRIDQLEARPTDRGLVLTLGDVLFATGAADIQGGSNQNLERLVDFLHAYPDRSVLIEGHTDNVGSAPFNQTLSQQRAESVHRYLTDHGIQSSRLSASGYGLDRPVASNDSSNGRQQNRRVEVVIEN